MAESLSFISIVVILYIIMDPVGNIPAYLQMVKGMDPWKQRYVLCRELLIALVLMILFNYIGEFLFSILDVSDVAVSLSSGVILFLIALKILFPAFRQPALQFTGGRAFHHSSGSRR